MCKYCEQGYSICDNRKELGIELHLAKAMLVAYGLDENGWDISISCEINYCPVCGKNINKKGE